MKPAQVAYPIVLQKEHPQKGMCLLIRQVPNGGNFPTPPKYDFETVEFPSSKLPFVAVRISNLQRPDVQCARFGGPFE